MRLRQVALASHGLDAAVKAFNDAFGLKVAYNDPHIDTYGLRNAVLPAGTAFLEVVEPIREDASAARFLNRRGGDAGYMIIIQVADAEAERARVAQMGVRVVDDIDTRAYRCAHFHPADFGGMLASFDQQRTAPDFREPYGDWMPAGPDWRAARTPEVLDLTAVTLSAADASALARRWSELTGRGLDADDPLRLPLDHGEIRFRAGEPGGVTSICELELAMVDPQRALERARTARLGVTADGVLIGGVRFRPVLAQSTSQGTAS